MRSRSEQGAVEVRARPAPELVARLRRGKEELRQERERLPLPEKVRLVMELQRSVYPLLAQRQLEAWKRPWGIEP